MACKRSAVRSRLAPPAFARFASFGWASPKVYRSEASEGCPAIARRATAGLGKPFICRAIDPETKTGLGKAFSYLVASA
jgi:hypothetical protein